MEDTFRYRETPKQVLGLVTTWTGADLPLYRDNRYHLRRGHGRLWPYTAVERPATRVDFYPHLFIGRLGGRSGRWS
ncbi:MAG TPA: hypothetical protein VFE32_02785 [Puia sp.]|nr:hypothetical protein [Puia sp.]